MERIISRTIKTERANILVWIDAENRAEKIIVDIPANVDIKKPAKVLAYAAQFTKHTPVKLLSHETVERLYEMLETDFIKYATPVEKRGQSIGD